MFLASLLFCSLAFAETKALAVQICLDRAGYSCNTIDGVWGGKSEQAFRAFFAARNRDLKPTLPSGPDQIYDRYFSKAENLFRVETVTQADLDALVKIPSAPADKAKLPRMGYETIKEMFAERGHLSQRGLERLNPGVNWDHVQPGQKLVIPDFPSIEEELAVGSGMPRAAKRPSAALVRVSLSRFEVSVYDEKGASLAFFPCSIAKDKSKRPAEGELKVVTKIPHPNYTYTPHSVPKGQKASKHILMDGPNCPVGVAWIGLNIPSYGIHGTPQPESIGSAESHGCFRLSNWNAARLYALVNIGTKVMVDP